MSRWWLRTLVIGAVLLHGVPACLSDDSLNPQPLPPDPTNDENSEHPPRAPGDGKTGGEGSNADPNPPPYAGADGGVPEAGGDQ